MATYYFPAQQFLQAFSGLGLANIAGTPGSFTFFYVAGTASDAQTIIENAAALWDWEPLSNPPPYIKQATGNVVAFVAACWADVTLSAAAKVEIANVALTLMNWQFIPAAVTQYWTYLLVSSPAWLDSGTQTIIEGYATTYGVPLT
jgi:hypothetical protein